MKVSENSISLFSVFISFLFLFRDVFADPARHLCPPDQRDAILEFKNKFQFPEPCLDRPLESWANNSDCCYWEGIRCDSIFGDVIKLNLTDSCLHGQFNSNSTIFLLRSLPFLTTLDLSRNEFSGNIPSSLGNLSRLTTLDLSRNELSGEIPSSLGNLLNLIDLDLSYNDFSGEIPSSLGNLSRLSTLNLFQNIFTGKVPSSFEKLSHLTFISFSENKLSGEIPSSFGNLSHLTSLDLSQNNFVGEISSFFGSSNHLTAISLGGNKFSGMLPPNISSLSNLEFFYVYSNAFTGPIPSSLFTIPSLIEIYLSNNQLNGTLDLGNISESSKIKDLYLGDNNLMGTIPRSISKLVNLWRLDLSHLNIQGSVDFSIFSHLKSLRYLYLSHLNTTATLDLNAILPYFKSLDTLDLSGTHVSTENRSLISDPPLLRDLNLSGCGIIEFPELLRTQHNMGSLDVSNNKIKGQVPGWLWELPVLEYVSLSNNTLIGFQTPTKHVRETSLTDLFGANNNFTGKIPGFICEFHSLTTLDLSNNKFSGSFPSCLGNFSSSLEVINLRQNHLSGGIPENMSRSLVSLDLGHNRLVGKLPRSFIRIPTLQVLNVESNRISDTFPFWLSSLPELQVLVLRSNAFHGPIHHTPFSKLRIIDINHNHFNGTLPSDFFVNWTAMYTIAKNEEEKYMGTYYYSDSVVMVNKGVESYLERILKIFTAVDFSGNRFEGEIPRSIGLLKELHVLNFSNNAFTGQIPSSMGNMAELESLDVSQNKISGEIPQELGNLSFLSYMNFSHNQLTGLVPGGTQFLTQPCSSFEDNPGLYGPSLDEVCGCLHATTCQRSETPEPEEEDEEEEVLSWTAAAIGFVPGVFFGFTMGYVLVSYKPEWFTKAFVPNKRRQHNSSNRRRV